MKSKTTIEKQLRKKTNSDLVKTIILAKKHDSWLNIARALSTPRRKRLEINLDSLNKFAKESDIIVVPGKVLSVGNFDNKNKIVALNFSKVAKEKIINAGGKVSSILEEIKSNHEAKGIKIIK